MRGYRQLSGKRALGEERVRTSGPRTESGVEPRVTRVHHPPAVLHHGICDALLGVRYLSRIEHHTAPEIERSPRLDLADAQRISGISNDRTERRRKLIEECVGTW